MDLKKIFLGFILLTLFTGEVLANNDISVLRMSQAWQEQNDIIAYMHIRKANDQPVANLAGAKLTGFIGSHQVALRDLNRFDKSNEGVAYIFLVDVSKSLSKAQFQKIRIALIEWIDSMHPKDRAAIITFGTDVKQILDFTGNKEILKQAVSGLKPTDNDTQLHLGLARAMEIGRRKDLQLPTRRVILTLSDGRDDFTGGMTSKEVLRKMQENPVPIYAIGFVNRPYTQTKESYLKTLGEFARTSGGMYFKAGNTPFATIYSLVKKEILNVWTARINCSTCPRDGGVYRLQMTLTDGRITLTDGLNIRLLPPASSATSTIKKTAAKKTHPLAPPPVKKSKKKSSSFSLFIGMLVIFIMGLIVFFFLRKPKKTTGYVPPPFEPLNIPEASIQPLDNLEKEDKETTEPDYKEVFTPFDDEPPTRAETVSGIQVRLTLLGYADKSKAYVINLVDKVIIGRRKDCNVYIPEDDEISGQHCELSYEEDIVYIKDLDSTNGTYLNGVPLSGQYRLQNGDMILIGRTEMRVSLSLERTRKEYSE